MNPIDLHVLRRIAECGHNTMPAIVADCVSVSGLQGRILVMQSIGYLKLRGKRGAERLSLTEYGRAALAAEPRHHRDSLSFTNR